MDNDHVTVEYYNGSDDLLLRTTVFDLTGMWAAGSMISIGVVAYARITALGGRMVIDVEAPPLDV